MKNQDKIPLATLKCVLCGNTYSSDTVTYTCACSPSDGILDVNYDYEALAKNIRLSDIANSKEVGMWRYLPLLPVPAGAELPEISVGNTPLTESRFLSDKVNLRSVMIKDDSRLPSGSLKDRASAMAVVQAKAKGFDTIATASTGNAAAALACLCANFGIRAVVYVPADAPAQKLLAIRAYGARIITVNGSYDEAFERCLTDARKNGWYIRSTAYNPYMTEGKKTVAYEICEQLGWAVPNAIFVGVGDGSIIGGIHKGFKDLMSLGWTKSLPRLFGTQAEGSNYLADAWSNGRAILDGSSKPARTIADSLQAELPKDRVKAMRAVVDTEGAFVQVNDPEILLSMKDYALVGYLAEPASAAALAGLYKACNEDLLNAEDTVVLVNTGTGLKDTRSIEKMLGADAENQASQLAKIP